MARRRIQFTEKKIEQFIKDGRGQADGKDYIPWIQVGDFISSGRSHRIYGTKTGRIHHFFSDLEAKYYYILIWSDSIVDIREQFPLFPVSDTEAIAAQLSIKHPKAVGSSISSVMTTDFLLTVEREKSFHFEARSVKYSQDLEKPRVVEKQAIEREYWASRGIPWKLVTEKSISMVKANNIKMLLGYYTTPLTDVLDNNTRESLAYELLKLLSIEDGTLKSLTARTDLQFGLDAGSSLPMLYHLAAHKIIPVCIDSKISPTMKINTFIDKNQLQRCNPLEQGGAILDSFA